MPSPALPPGHGWLPLAFGAIDVRGSAAFSAEAELLVLPARPGEALCLFGPAAALWRGLVETAPLAPSAATPDDDALLEQFHLADLATVGAAHPARIDTLRPPVLSSPLHELVYALVARVADEHGIRCVFVKGPALHLQGLRDREHSGDVDVWCDPARVEDLVAALQAWGWRRAADPWRGTTVHHTVTLTPERWGCEIDVHRRIPGLVLDDETSFDRVHRDATSMRFGSVDLLVPDPATHAVLAALHAVRPIIAAGAPTAFASSSAAELLSRAPGAVQRARDLGAVPALRRELEPLCAPGSLEADDVGTPHDWVWRQQPDHVRAYAMAMRPLPWRVRLRLVVRFLWPPDDVALASARQAGETPTSPRRARWARLRRGMREWIAARR